MARIDDIKNLENMGYEAFHIDFQSDGGIYIDFIKTKHGAIGKRKSLNIPVGSRTREEYLEIFSYLTEKYFVNSK